MAASDPHQHPPTVSTDDASAPSLGALDERLHEEIARAERHGVGLSCLLVTFDDLEEMTREHGRELSEQTLEYVASALQRELRCFDRVGRTAQGDVIVLLPGADGPRAEVVARRALHRLRTIKVESAGTRRPLQISVGLSAWREGIDGRALVERARAALRSVSAGNGAVATLGRAGAQ
jgi:diguanylate cyclase (GGDEF)-like protein